jgi:flagellar M-ring protein FliF
MAAATMKLTDIPAVRQAFVLLTVAAAVAGGISLYMWSQKPAFTPLYANLSDRDSAAITEALRGANIQFHMEPNGAISVPEANLYDARLKLAAAGLPQGASGGFESLGEDGFGVSSTVENARYQRALETELTRTIASIRSVQSARVHLALPKATAFAREQSAVSASVFIQLFPGRSLDPAQVQSVVHLVASSIPDLKPANVTVIDQTGRLLTSADDGSDAALNATQYELTRRMEEDYARRIQSLLLPMTGAGRVSAQVSADLDFTVTEEARESYTPDPAKVRSEQVSQQSAGLAPNATAAGVPGAASNQPAQANVQPVNAPANAASQPAIGATSTTSSATGSQSRSETRNFELDKTLTHVRQPSGRVKRLSVAVLVDQIPQPAAKPGDKAVLAPLTDDQLTQVKALVKEAVGFDEKRGDTLSVMNAAFQREAPPAAIPALPLWQQPEVLDWAKRGLGGLLVLIVAFSVLRPALKELTTVRQLPAPVGATVISDNHPAMAGGIGGGPAAIGHSGGGGMQYEDKLALARSAVAQDPKKVAQVVRTWVGDSA